MEVRQFADGCDVGQALLVRDAEVCTHRDGSEYIKAVMGDRTGTVPAVIWDDVAQAVAVEYRDDGIRCNVILPSVIDTPANRASMPNADHDRWVKPAEIATVISHLLSPDAAVTSGATIPVYGRA